MVLHQFSKTGYYKYVVLYGYKVIFLVARAFCMGVIALVNMTVLCNGE